MKTRLAVLFLVLATLVNAQTRQVATQQVTTLATSHSATLTWLLPATCVDGSPCTPVAINVYKIVGTCGAPTTQFTLLVSLTALPLARSYTDSGLAPATTYCYYVTALLAQPAVWSSSITYTGGQMVTYNGAVYVALNNANANLNQAPSTATTFWSPGTVESAASNTAGGSTGTAGPPSPPTNLVITMQ